LSQGARHFFAPGIYRDCRRPGGLSLPATVAQAANPWPRRCAAGTAAVPVGTANHAITQSARN